MRILHIAAFFLVFNWVVGFMAGETDFGQPLITESHFDNLANKQTNFTADEVINVTDVGSEVDNALSWGRSTAKGQSAFGKFKMYAFGMAWFAGDVYGLESLSMLLYGFITILYTWTGIQLLRGVGGKGIE